MNGIDYSSLTGNTGLFSNQASNKNEVSFFANAINKKAQARTADDRRQANADQDTYEYSGRARDVKAGYSRPQRTDSANGKGYRAMDSNGIQDGIELSDSAKNLLAELRKKYDSMDIKVAEWFTDEEQDYYAGRTSKAYSVLINPELLEKMASDGSVREQYESVLDGAGNQFDELKKGLGDDADKIRNFSITMDKDGNVSYAIELLKNMTETSKAGQKEESSSGSQQERISERRAERKKAEQERLERIEEKRIETERITASSIEELVAAAKAKLYPNGNLGEEAAVQAVTES